MSTRRPPLARFVTTPPRKLQALCETLSASSKDTNQLFSLPRVSDTNVNGGSSHECLAAATTERETARLFSCSLVNSGDWLSVVPLKDLGLSLSAAEFRVALCFRLAIPLLSEESICPKCSKSLDVFGDHALACSSGGDRVHRVYATLFITLPPKPSFLQSLRKPISENRVLVQVTFPFLLVSWLFRRSGGHHYNFPAACNPLCRVASIDCLPLRQA